MPRRFEFSQGTSNKFWAVEVEGTTVTTCWGRIGTNGQSKTKAFGTAAQAASECDKLVREKTKEGYVEVSSGGGNQASSLPARTAPVTPPAPAEATCASPAPQAGLDGASTQSASAASEAATSPVFLGVRWTEEARRKVLPRRGADLPPATLVDLKPMRTRLASVLESGWNSGWALVTARTLTAGLGREPALADATRRGLEFLQALAVGDSGAPAAADAAAAALVMCGMLLSEYQGWAGNAMHAMGAAQGPVRMLEALVRAWSLDLTVTPEAAWLCPSVEPKFASMDLSRNNAMEALRLDLARLDDASYAAAVAVATRARSGAPLSVRVALDYLLPTETSWSAEDAALLPRTGDLPPWAHALLGCVADPALLEQVCSRVMGSYGSWMAYGYIETMLDNAGPGAVGALSRLLERSSTSDHKRQAATGLTLLETAAAARALADHCDDNHVRPVAVEYFTRRSDLALPALASRVVGRSRVSDSAMALLTTLLGACPDVRGDLTEAERQVVEGILARRSQSYVDAAVEALPSVLVLPPWAAGQKRVQRTPITTCSVPVCEERVDVPEGGQDGWSQLRVDGQDVRLSKLTDSQLLSVLQSAQTLEGLWRTADTLCALVRRLKLEAIPFVLRFSASDALPALARVDSPRVALMVADALATKRSLRGLAAQWLVAHPTAAACGLIPTAVGEAGPARDAAVAALRFMASRGQQEAITAVAERCGDAVADAVVQLLSEDPLLDYPARLPKLPDFWTPDTFTRPLLKDREHAVPLSGLVHLGTMLAISPLDKPYAGLALVRESCDAASLEAFAWDLFSAWLVAGAPAKEQWAFLAVGHLGGDEAARRLAPLVREWPGMAASQRAFVGLDVLRAIGTDVALMHLHGIAQKVKFQGLQARAREKMDEIAEARGLSTEELADRLVPDLDLEESGTRTLDFGPRQFRVTFDEALRPVVLDLAGKRLGDLPKPTKADTSALAEAATQTWKALKKDVKTLAADQILRLEMACTLQRRWDAATFQTFLVSHPLVVHLTRRLIWGTYDGDGRLAETFRVAEDRSLADAHDEPYALAATATVGIPHPLEQSPELQRLWGQVLADYEILQPFAQLGRDTYALTDEERTASELRRVEGVTCHYGKVLGLEKRGWRRGAPQDAGVIGWMEKPLPDGYTAFLWLEGGLYAGMMSESPEQTIQTCTVSKEAGWRANPASSLPLSKLNPITFSELVSDLETLRT